MSHFCGWMKKEKQIKGKSFFLFLATFIVISIIFLITVKTPLLYIPMLRVLPNSCHMRVSEQTITPLTNTKHLLVSAYMDQRVAGYDVRIIGIFNKTSIQPLHCIFCCGEELSITTTPASVLVHPEDYGFAFVTTDVMCQIPQNCKATHVALLTSPDKGTVSDHFFLPIRNQRTDRKEENQLQFNITICISNLFGGYNNVLQAAQTLEMYRLLGVNRVVIYNTSCGSELDRLLQSYVHEGFLEVVPWPIDKHLKPSSGWLFSSSGGDVHYFGQITTLNECIYRSMDRSRYVLLNDLDEIIMPYQHNDLMSLMNVLQQQQPDTGVFLIENHIFPKTQFDPSGRFHLPQWAELPGVNILEHIYREEPARNIYHPHKMIVRPRFVEQTSVHEVLKNFGKRYKVPLDVCRIIHVRVALQGSLTLEQLHVDKRLWDFQQKLIPNVDRVLERAGLQRSVGRN